MLRYWEVSLESNIGHENLDTYIVLQLEKKHKRLQGHPEILIIRHFKLNRY